MSLTAAMSKKMIINHAMCKMINAVILGLILSLASCSQKAVSGNEAVAESPAEVPVVFNADSAYANVAFLFLSSMLIVFVKVSRFFK